MKRLAEAVRDYKFVFSFMLIIVFYRASFSSLYLSRNSIVERVRVLMEPSRNQCANGT